MHRKHVTQQSRQYFFNPYVPVWASSAIKISYIQHINDTEVLL